MFPASTRVATAVLLAAIAGSAHGLTFSVDPRYDPDANQVTVLPSATFGKGGTLWTGGYKGSLTAAGAFDSPSFMTFDVEINGPYAYRAGPTEYATYSLAMPAAYTTLDMKPWFGSAPQNGWGPNAVSIGNRLGQLLT